MRDANCCAAQAPGQPKTGEHWTCPDCGHSWVYNAGKGFGWFPALDIDYAELELRVLAEMERRRIESKQWLFVERYASPTGRTRRDFSGGGLTFDELVRACKNIGYDLTCGQCAAIFYTGFGNYLHDPHCTTDKEQLR